MAVRLIIYGRRVRSKPQVPRKGGKSSIYSFMVRLTSGVSILQMAFTIITLGACKSKVLFSNIKEKQVFEFPIIDDF